MPFSSVSSVEFEQVNVCWVPPYHFMNAEICTKILVKKQFMRKGYDLK